MKMSRLEAAIRIANDLIDALNRADRPAALRLFDPDCAIDDQHTLSEASRTAGRAAVEAFVDEQIAQCADGKLVPEEMIGYGMLRCVVRWRRVAPDGRTVARGVDLYRLRNERISEIIRYVKA